MTEPEIPTLSETLARAEQAERKWQEYERDYILPCFKWAEELGYDLHEAVRENPGRNCVDLFVRWLRGQARTAKSLAESLDNIREALGQRETHHLVMAGDIEILVKAIELCARDGGCRAMLTLRRLRMPEEGPFESYPETGTACAACGQPQRQTPGGMSCPQGHGGAESVAYEVPKESS